jgi:hypothetical protein
MTLPWKDSFFHSQLRSAESALIFLSIIKVSCLVYLVWPLINWPLEERASSPFVIIHVARLWVTISRLHVSSCCGTLTIFFIAANHCFLTLFSKDHCRLSSNQPISEALPNNKWGCTLAVISKMLLFGFPNHYEALFKIFWADQLVDPLHWHEHASEMVQDLKQTMLLVS